MKLTDKQQKQIRSLIAAEKTVEEIMKDMSVDEKTVKRYFRKCGKTVAVEKKEKSPERVKEEKEKKISSQLSAIVMRPPIDKPFTKEEQDQIHAIAQQIAGYEYPQEYYINGKFIKKVSKMHDK